jgi:plastocyanin
MAAAPPARKPVIIRTIAGKGSYAYQPKVESIQMGTVVVWKNPSDAPHTVTFDKNRAGIKFDKTLDEGKAISYMFKKPGIYTYICTFHPYMHGKIVVTR